ncbi:hypothetical protein LINPERPRIM_LOCUS17595 [Linum perenne]
MHYNGLLLGNEYKYGLVAHFDRIDPDYFSMIELNAMAKMINVEGDYFQYLWAKPDGGIADGLQSIECEEDILAFTKARNRIGDDGEVLGVPFTCIQMYMKNLTRFEAWKRMGEIKMHLVDDFVENRRVQFSLEELHDEPLPQVPGDGPSSKNCTDVLLLDWTEPTPTIPEEEQLNPQTESVVVDELTEPPIDDVVVDHVAVNDWTEGDEVSEQPVEDVAVDPLEVDPPEVDPPEVDNVQVDPPEDNTATRWLSVEDVLEEMRREEELNAPEDPSDIDGRNSEDLDGWSSPTIPSSDDDVGNYWDGQYNPYTSSDDSMYVEEQYYRSSSSSYQAHESEEESSDSQSVNQEAPAENSWEREYDETNNEDGYFNPVDRQRPEDELLNERGWGSEEDVTLGPDRYPTFQPARDLDAAEIVIGREFESFAHFKEFCRLHAIRNRRGVKFPVNDKIRCRCVCIKNCGFWLSARTRSGSDTVTLISGHPEHDCLVEEDLRAANPGFLAQHYVALFRIDPTWSLPNIVHTVITDFGLKINKMKAYRTKRAALKLIHGEESQQFTKLWDYGAELRRTNPGTTVSIQYDGLTFQSIYICLDALKRGFKDGCRRFIGLDGCFLKGVTGWQILTAVSVDGNNGIFPIAWAIVERESQSSWNWFMENLKTDLEIGNRPGWTFMSDRQKVRHS